MLFEDLVEKIMPFITEGIRRQKRKPLSIGQMITLKDHAGNRRQAQIEEIDNKIKEILIRFTDSDLSEWISVNELSNADLYEEPKKIRKKKPVPKKSIAPLPFKEPKDFEKQVVGQLNSPSFIKAKMEADREAFLKTRQESEPESDNTLDDLRSELRRKRDKELEQERVANIKAQIMNQLKQDEDPVDILSLANQVKQLPTFAEILAAREKEKELEAIPKKTRAKSRRRRYGPSRRYRPPSKMEISDEKLKAKAEHDEIKRKAREAAARRKRR